MSSRPAMLRRQGYAPLAHIPDQLIIEILSFCTVKSLARFSCLGKFVNFLISDSFFVELHLKRSSRNPYLTLLSGESQSDVDCSVVPFPVIGFLDNQLIVLPDDEYYRLKEKDCRWVVGSCNGLLCLLGYAAILDYRAVWFRIWNPATKKISERLGMFSDRNVRLHNLLKFSFGYDNSTRTYKIVAVLRATVKVFCLGENVWREIQNFPVIHRNHVYPYQYTNPGVNDSVYLSSSLNWLAIRKSSLWKDVLVEEYVIVSLDLCTETFTQFLPPSEYYELAPFEPTISVLKDRLSYLHDFKRTDLVIWQMMEFGVEQSWTPFIHISYQSLQSIHDDPVGLEYFQWSLLHLSGNMDTVILANNQEKQAYLYNLRDNTVELTTIADNVQWFSAKHYVDSLVWIS